MGFEPTSLIRTETELRALFGYPSRRVAEKQIDHIDAGAAAFLAHTTFIAMGTTNSRAAGDVSPKGGPAGFVKVLDEHHLAFGELPGNNRLDGFVNLLTDDRAGLIAVVPGMRETLRFNGHAMLSTDPDLLRLTVIDERLPKVAVVMRVHEVFLHCGKAMIRSGMWAPETWPDTSNMPTPACIFNAHIGTDTDPDGSRTSAALEHAYTTELWNDPT
jgi:PPOX class probable FMN-dependent enzyme